MLLMTQRIISFSQIWSKYRCFVYLCASSSAHVIWILLKPTTLVMLGPGIPRTKFFSDIQSEGCVISIYVAIATQLKQANKDMFDVT